MARHAKRPALALAATAAMLALAACGGGDGDEGTISGSFELVSGAPAGYEDLSGEATLERSEHGTTVSLELSGLKPDSEYIAHLHAEGCDQADPGGPHFQFDPNGSEEPPNEIHLEFRSDEAGDGEAEASNDREVPVGEAGSVVLHPAEDQMMAAMIHDEGGHSHPVKIACAELEGGGGDSTSTAAAGDHDAEGAAVPTIVVRDGEPVGGVRELEYDAGEEIRFRVESDVADEVHLHGYDVMEEVPAGGSVSFEIPAKIEGIFEVELEDRGVQIAELQVNP